MLGKKRQPLNQTVKDAYNRVRNKVNREIQKSKILYQKSYFEEHSSNLKKTWDGIKKIVNVKKTTNFTISQLNIKGNIVDNPQEISNKFNDFLSMWALKLKKLSLKSLICLLQNF